MAAFADSVTRPDCEPHYLGLFLCICYLAREWESRERTTSHAPLYNVIPNDSQVGGGKPKMRWYFKRNGWPVSDVLQGRAPATEQEQELLIDTLQV